MIKIKQTYLIVAFILAYNCGFSQDYTSILHLFIETNGKVCTSNNSIYQFSSDSIHIVDLNTFKEKNLHENTLQIHKKDSDPLIFNPVSLIQSENGFIVTGEDWKTQLGAQEEEIVFVEGNASMYSNEGTLLWQHSFSGPAKDIALRAAVNERNEVFISGVFQEEMSIDNDIKLSNNADSQNDVFILKLDEDGAFNDVNQFFGYGESFVHHTSCFGDSIIMLAGTFTDSFQYASDKTLEAEGKSDVFLLWLNNDLMPAHALSFGGLGKDNISSLFVDTDSSIYIIGAFEDEIIFDVQHSLISKGRLDAYILNMDFSGKVLWAHSLGAMKNDYAYDMRVKDYIYVSSKIKDVNEFGYTSANSNTGPFAEMVMMRFDKDGNEIDAAWMEDGTTVHASCIAVTDDKSIYLAGTYRNEFVLGSDTLEAAETQNTFIVKLEKECPDLDIKMTEKDNFCAGDSVQLIATPGFSSYAWSNDLSGESIYVTAPGMYFLEASFLDECIAVDSIEVSIDDIKSANFSYEVYNQSGLCFYKDESNVENVSWNWNYGDNSETSSIQNPVHEYQSEGNYEVTLTITNDDGCSESISKNISIEKDLTDIGLNNTDAYALKLSPNPATDIMYLSYHLPVSSAINYYIYDAKGNLHGEYDILEQAVGDHQEEMDVNSLSPGIYLLRFIAKDAEETYTNELKFCVIQ